MQSTNSPAWWRPAPCAAVEERAGPHGELGQKEVEIPGFAAGVDRSVITRGAEMLGVTVEQLIEDTIMGMREVADTIGLRGTPAGPPS
jgi:hypothetical protein